MKSKKGVPILFILILVLALTAIHAQQEVAVEKAYMCLETELATNCGDTKSTKQNAFNVLAIGYNANLQSVCTSSLLQKASDNCWGETEGSLCTIKSTALAILALDHVGKDVGANVEWLLSKKIQQTGLTWYLEIDSTNKTECDINGKKVIVDDNKKIIGSPPAGLVKAYNDYWFEIKDSTKNYTISCDKDFVTALLYQTSQNSAYFVSSSTQTASEFDTVTEQVHSYCFSTANVCDYEGTLWATLALAKTGEDVTPFIPYLTAMAEKSDNRKFLPSAFLYILTHSDDYYNELISLQKSNNYWDESRNKFYDTAVALLALNGVSTDEVESAKRYLTTLQLETGCWPSDTAFIVHAGWPKNPTVASSGGGSSPTFCEDFGHYCLSVGQCDLTDTLTNFYCASSAEVCCQKNYVEPSCSDKNGIVCTLDQQCQGETVLASDTGACCIGDCIALNNEPECEKESYICKSSCSEMEEEKVALSSSCSFGDVCCGRKPVESSSTNYWLIILLVVLIFLVILAILFRNQLKIWMFRMRSGYSDKKVTRPPYGPQAGFSPPTPLFRRPALLPQARPQQRILVRKPQQDKEFEDTMKKLRDMAK